MGTNEEITKVEVNPLTMAELIADDGIQQSLSCAIELLDVPTALDDGFPFLAETTHIRRFPAIFK